MPRVLSWEPKIPNAIVMDIVDICMKPRKLRKSIHAWRCLFTQATKARE